jgi:hypothetical protein
VQGRLRNEPLIVEVETECAHCGQAIQFTLDSDLTLSLQEVAGNPGPLLFEPDVDWQHFDKANIIGDY